MKGSHWIWMPPPVFQRSSRLRSIVLAKAKWQASLLHTWKTNHSGGPTGRRREISFGGSAEQNGGARLCRGTRVRLMPALSSVTSAHTGVLSAAPVKWCLLSWRLYVSPALRVPVLVLLCDGIACQRVVFWSQCEVIAEAEDPCSSPPLCRGADEITGCSRASPLGRGGACKDSGGNLASKITSLSLLCGSCSKICCRFSWQKKRP